MAKLIREFTSVDDDSQRIPTATNVAFFLSLTELSPEMVVDRGVNRDKGLPRYLLETSNLQLTEIVVTELQIFIQQASGLIAERKSFFIVDPGDTMMSILRGTSSLAQLNAAWSALRSRVELGMKAWKKYGVEYQHSPEERPVLSPLSTLPELYTPLSDIEGDEQRLRYLFTHIPHHKEQLSSEGYSALQKTRSWVHILPLPDSLKEAFVNDQKEDNGPNPAVSNSEARLDKGKAKASIHSRRRGKDTITTTNDPVPSGSSNSIWMGMDTPFKGANKWFVDNNKSNRSRQPGTSRAQGEDTNILLGIATPLPPKTTTIKDWGDRERPPHQPDPKVTNVATSVRSDASHNKGRKDQRDRTGGDSPEDGSSDGSSTVSSRSRRSNRAGRRRRRSTTPRPRRRSSSTPRPRRRRPAPDDDGGSESSGDGDGSSFSSDSSSWDSEYTSSSRRSRHRSRRAKVSAPYGNSIPTIDSKLKQEDLPTWDGNPSTAIQYFWRVQQCATLGGYIPAALGYWLWLKLKEGSDVQTWFATLPFAEQSRMRGHWVDYLKGIKEGYLGRTWQFDIGEEYKNQYFRQPGFERELPKSFIARRIMYTRMLAKSDDGGPLEVHLVMAKAPLSWRTILVLENIASSSLLYTKAAEHQQSLLEASKSGVTNVITTDNLALHLRRLGYSLDRAKFQQSLPQDRRAHLTSADPIVDVQPKEIFVSSAMPEVSDSALVDDEILKEVYQVMKKKQRAPPPGGYMFSKNDHVTTKMGRLPPSPCKCCGSSNHWDKECPDWAVYLEKTSKSSYQNEKESMQEEELYQSAYGVLLSQKVASMQIDESKLAQDFKKAFRIESVQQIDGECKAREVCVGHARVSMEEIEDEYFVMDRSKPKSRTHLLVHVDDENELPDIQDKRKRSPPTKHSTRRQEVAIEEVEDESWQAYQMKPKAAKHVLEDEYANDLDDSTGVDHVAVVDQRGRVQTSPTERFKHSQRVTIEEIEDESWRAYLAKPKSVKHVLDDECTSDVEGNNTDGEPVTVNIGQKREDRPVANDAQTDADIPPPPKIDKPVRLRKKRVTPPGFSALGVSVLSTKGWVGNVDNPQIDLRLDSCADVTLISAEFYASLKNVPKEQRGPRTAVAELEPEVLLETNEGGHH